MNFSSDDLYNKWLAYLRDQGSNWYLNSMRVEHIDVLMELFFNGKIGYEEAKMYKKKVLKALTHEEGRKGTGKYKGWKECVELDFDACVANWYVKLSENSENNNRKDFVEDSLIPEDPCIKKWISEKYGDKCTDSLITDAHTIGNILNIQYLTERFDKS